MRQLPSSWLDATYVGGDDWPYIKYANADKTIRIAPASEKPYIFIHGEDLERSKRSVLRWGAEVEKGPFVSVRGKKCVKLIVDSPKDVHQKRFGAGLGLRSELEGVGVETFESDIQFVRRVMIDEDIRQSEIKDRAGLDIEVDARAGFPVPEKAEFPIIAVSVVGSHGTHFYSDFCEGEMLEEAYACVNKYYGLVYGWNWKNFDGLYLTNRIRRLEKAKQIPRGIHFFPVQTMDAMLNYQKLTIWGFMGKKYKLEVVAKRHLWQCPSCGEIYAIDSQPFCLKCNQFFLETRRVDHSSMKSKMDAETMWNSFISDKKELKEYNVMDAKLVFILDTLLHLSEPYLEIAKMFPIMLRDSPMMSMVLETIVMREAAHSVPRLVFPNRFVTNAKLVGGYTPWPVAGIHRKVLSVDFHNLYPSIMATFKLSPELVMLYRAWKDSGLDFDVWTERVFSG